jgi:hypothetical protein
MAVSEDKFHWAGKVPVGCGPFLDRTYLKKSAQKLFHRKNLFTKEFS